MESDENIAERYLAQILLMGMAGKASSLIDKFSNWLLLGYSAAVTFLVGNVDVVSKYIHGPWLKPLISTLLWLVVLGVLQKLLAVLVASASAGAEIARAATEKALERGATLNVAVVLSDLEDAMLPPMRWLVARANKRAQAGNITSSAKTIAKLSQIQGILSVAQVILVMCQLYRISREVAF